ncbi:carbohydrate ABC transporter permease [Sediminispirochaeta bajacaliforniensis]|uniref:carbohydrate ABC transporter permease n=1 Tax=Sediminispirochaeta bajacaliforniensis TaxID=148 RepID=UPI000376A901|nr:carbohydrate ABC transporter permease [Sediminispirochaeta bajacaliforniensis]
MRKHIRKKSSNPLFWIVLVVIMGIILFPIYWIIATSCKTPVEVILPKPTLFPHDLTFMNYKAVLQSGFLHNMLNSLIVAVCATGLSLFLSFTAAYALVRYRFPLAFNSLFLVWVLVVKILPPVVLAIPLYTMFNSMHLINKLLGLILVYQVYTLPYCIWMIFGFLKSVPISFEEAALIDGASRWYILGNIVLPLARTGIIATSIFGIISAWDEFLFALLFVRTPSLETLPLVIVNYIGEYETLWGELMSIGLLTTVPVLLFSNFVYKYYTKGFSMSLK